MFVTREYFRNAQEDHEFALKTLIKRVRKWNPKHKECQVHKDTPYHLKTKLS